MRINAPAKYDECSLCNTIRNFVLQKCSPAKYYDVAKQHALSACIVCARMYIQSNHLIMGNTYALYIIYGDMLRY